MRLNILLCVFLLFSCSYKTNKICDYELNLISKEDIFNYSNEYYVLVYLDKCMSCRDIKLRLMSYCLSSSKQIYYIDFLNTNFYENDVKESNIGIRTYSEIYINSVPHLFIINNKKIENEWHGFESISDYLFGKQN